MATQLITNYFRLHNVNQFRESISETANSVYYVFAGRHTEYSTGDSNIDPITNSVQDTLYTAYDEMVFGKRVGSSDVMPVAPRYNWTSNTKYAAYRSTEDLSEKAYYVAVDATSSFHVFKCLDNNGNVASTVAPDVTQTAPDDEFYSTSDGYVWKYMYSMDSTTFNKFATASYMPVLANNEVVGNAVSGAIDVVVVNTPGSHYNTYLQGTFISTDLRVGGNPLKYNIANTASASNNFYNGSFIYITNGTGSGQGRRIVNYTVIGNSKTIEIDSAFSTNPDTTSTYEITPYVLITGDGSGAIARAKVNSYSTNSVSQVEIISRGSGYTYASASVVGNTGGVQNAASMSVILGPKGGHGSNPEYELGARALAMSVKFETSETGTIPVSNDYRTVGIIKDPLFANVVLTLSSLSGAFGVGNLVTQSDSLATGYVTAFDTNKLSLTNVNGVFVTSKTVSQGITASGNVTSYEINGQSKNFNTFDQRQRFTFTPVAGTFVPDEKIYQTDLQIANAIFHSNTSTNVYITHSRGTLNTGNTIIGTVSEAVARLDYAYHPDLVVGSGEVVYLENESPITRSASQSETIKIILQF
jgi:hypothetical protein